MKAKIRSVRQMVCQGELGTYGNVSKILHPTSYLHSLESLMLISWIELFLDVITVITLLWRNRNFTNLGLYPHYFNLIL